MQAYDLIWTDGHVQNLTEKGYQALELGGFELWKAANEKRDMEAHQAALDSAQATIDSARSAKQSMYAAFFSGIVALAAFGLSVYQSLQSDKVEQELNALRSQVKAIDSLRTIQSQSQKPTVQRQDDAPKPKTMK